MQVMRGLVTYWLRALTLGIAILTLSATATNAAPRTKARVAQRVTKCLVKVVPLVLVTLIAAQAPAVEVAPHAGLANSNPVPTSPFLLGFDRHPGRPGKEVGKTQSTTQFIANDINALGGMWGPAFDSKAPIVVDRHP